MYIYIYSIYHQRYHKEHDSHILSKETDAKVYIHIYISIKAHIYIYIFIYLLRATPGQSGCSYQFKVAQNNAEKHQLYSFWV